MMQNRRKEKPLLGIGEAAAMLHVSIDTLRRWDRSGKLKAVRRSERGNRYYRREELELFLQNAFALARTWAQSGIPPQLPSHYYCEVHPRFQSRLEKMGLYMMQREKLPDVAPLIVAVAGEIGNNSFDHNLGSWPDVPGVFFGYDINKRIIVLADRGQGIRATLQRVRPDISTDTDALTIAFTEYVSGRAPERRGNGLKFVREVAETYGLGVELQSGNAVMRISNRRGGLESDIAPHYIRGTLAKITF